MSVTNEIIVQNPTSFDPMKHRPPKYDISGRLKKSQIIPGAEQYNILVEKEKIKIPWEDKSSIQGEPMTQEKLKERRRRERIPDISYDLDKDGFVGGRDYVLAKRFDVDNDGKLNEQEKKAAYEAIHNNIEDNYVWNIDNQGGKRAFRIMQKRGKIIDAENFLPISETYPQHPLSSKIPDNNICTRSELADFRKMNTKMDIEKKIKEWELHNPQVFVHEPLNINTANQPPFKSVTQLKNHNHRLARLKCGLKEYEDDIKIGDKDPGLNYIYDPKHKIPKDLKDELKKENIEQSKRLTNNQHKDEIARLNAREDEVFAKLYSDEDRLTYNKLKEMRKKEVLDYNSKTFSRQTIGVHGHELPKFAESEEMKEFWKKKEGYVENPPVNSYVQFNENIKYWKKPEELLINEHKDEIPSPDPFRKEKVLKEQKDNLIIKVNNLNHFSGFDPNNPKPIDIEEAHRNHIYKWTTLVNQFAPQKFKRGRFFDSLPEQNGHTDEKEVYSSFTKDGAFHSDYLKDNNVKKKEEKVKANENEKVSQDQFARATRDSLFNKFSNKDAFKLPPEKQKSTQVRTKGF